MKIYDCIQFFNEENVLDLRLNILDEFINFFVIVESATDHQGNTKKLNFDIHKFTKFKKKIIYIVVEDTAEAIKKPHLGQNSLVERHQRNSITKGLTNCDDNDLVIISDVDEIPDLNKLNFFDKKNYAVFCQKKFDYKLNLLNETEGEWYGSKVCLKKNLKSPQWLRDLKFKQYPFWRIDKIRNLQIIKDGGWHFSYLQSPDNIVKKVMSFSLASVRLLNPEISKSSIFDKSVAELIVSTILFKGKGPLLTKNWLESILFNFDRR